MAFHYENLDDITRQHMQNEWELGNYYYSPRLTSAASQSWPELLRQASLYYDDAWLAGQLLKQNCFRDTESYEKNGKNFDRKINKESAATQLAEGEFNRLYVRGLCVRALSSGQDKLFVYRGKEVAQPRPESEAKVGTVVLAAPLLEALRNNDFLDGALGIPAGPNSGLTCRLL